MPKPPVLPDAKSRKGVFDEALLLPSSNVSIPGVLIEAMAYVVKDIIRKILEMDKYSFPGAQPVSLSKANVTNLLKEDYYVCEKSDGMRCLLLITSHPEQKTESIFMITRKDEIYVIPKAHIPKSHHNVKPAGGAVTDFPEGTILDGELVITKNKKMKYLIFDCLAMNGKLLLERTFDKRIAYVRELLMKPFLSYPPNSSNPNRPQIPFSLSVKTMEFAYAINKVLTDIPKLTHISDGLIFTSTNAPYIKGTNANILKWKPPHLNTVDFVLLLKIPLSRDPEDSEDEEYEDYDKMPRFNLYIGQRNRKIELVDTMYVTEQEWKDLKDLNEPLNGRIVECYKDENGRWRYLRFRDDKDLPNFITSYHSILNSIEDGITETQLEDMAFDIRDKWKARDSKRQEQQRQQPPHPNVPYNNNNNNNNVNPHHHPPPPYGQMKSEPGAIKRSATQEADHEQQQQHTDPDYKTSSDHPSKRVKSEQ